MTDSTPPPPQEENKGDVPPASPYHAPEDSSPPQVDPISKDLTKDDKTMAMLAHLLGILTSFVGPLIIWLVKKDEKGYAMSQSVEALNFQITVCILYVGLTITVIGAFFIPIVWLGATVFSIIAGMKANDGVNYRYPFALRLIK